MPETQTTINHLSFMPDRKSADFEAPYFKVEDPGGRMSWWIIKRYAEDDIKEYARWMVGADLGMTYGQREYGDTYVAEITAYATELTEVDGREPTADEVAEWLVFRSRVAGRVAGHG